MDSYYNKLIKRQPNGLLTSFCAELECDYHKDLFRVYQRCCREESVAKVTAKASRARLKTRERQASELSTKKHTILKQNMQCFSFNFILVGQQINYLSSC